MPEAITIPAGTVYGELTVVRTRNPGEPKILVRCTCGREREMWLWGLRKERATPHNCGAGSHRVGSKNGNYRHGHSTAGNASKTYHVWAEMLARCANPQHPRWHDYGGRGIDVDPRWRTFAHFLNDMGEKPDGYSIERVNNDRGYWPDNCTWIPLTEQSKNRRPRRTPYVRQPDGTFARIESEKP